MGNDTEYLDFSVPGTPSPPLGQPRFGVHFSLDSKQLRRDWCIPKRSANRVPGNYLDCRALPCPLVPVARANPSLYGRVRLRPKLFKNDCLRCQQHCRALGTMPYAPRIWFHSPSGPYYAVNNTTEEGTIDRSSRYCRAEITGATSVAFWLVSSLDSKRESR